MNFQKEISKIKKGTLAPLYVFLGTERFFVEQARRTWQHDVLPVAEQALNINSFNMLEQPIQWAIEEAHAVGFFGDRKIVLVENPYFLTGERDKQAVAHDLDALVRYIQQPMPQTSMVFFATYEQLDKRKKLVKLLMERAVFVDTHPLKEQELAGYLTHMVDHAGYAMDRDTMAYFLERVDYQLAVGVSELNKLFLYLGDHPSINRQTVSQLVPRSLQSDVFQLVDEALMGKTAAMVQRYRDLLLQKEEPLKLHALLMGQIRLLLQIKQLQQQGYQQSDCAALLKVHPYRIQLAWKQARQFQEGGLRRAFQSGVLLEQQLKTGYGLREVQGELYLVQLTDLLRREAQSQ